MPAPTIDPITTDIAGIIACIPYQLGHTPEPSTLVICALSGGRHIATLTLPLANALLAGAPIHDDSPTAGRRPDNDRLCSRLIRLVGAVLAEQHDEWIEGRRYLGLDVLARSRTDTPTDSVTEDTEEVTPALTA